MARYFLGQRYADAVYLGKIRCVWRRDHATHIPPHVGNALTISAMLVPSVRLKQEPRIQHQVTEDGPPIRSGVLKVVATLEHKPMILNAKLI
jgi:hypothetical protein